MTIGLPRDKASIDSKAGSIITTIKEQLRQAAAFSDMLSDTGIFADDNALIALGYTAGEVTTLRAAFTDLKALNNVANANGTVPSNNNFFFNAKKLTGTTV